jgi:hypothetical protein
MKAVICSGCDYKKNVPECNKIFKEMRNEIYKNNN